MNLYIRGCIYPNVVAMRKKKNLPSKPSADLCVNMSNALTRSAQSLTLAEKRLVMLAVSKLDSYKPATPENMAVKITAAEFSDEFGVSLNTAYDELQSAGKQLFHRYISFYGDDEKNNDLLTQMHWVGESKYHQKEGWIELHFWHKLAPQLFELGGLFTSYRLSRTAALRSIYSWRVFELLMQFKKTGLLKITVEEFCHAVEAPPTFRANFANLRIKVIEPAVKEIREKDGLAVTWEPVKVGRKVKALTFRFPLEHQATLPLPPQPPENTNSKKRRKPRKLPPSIPQDTQPLTSTEREKIKAEAKAELLHLQKMAELAGVPLETLLPKQR